MPKAPKEEAPVEELEDELEEEHADQQELSDEEISALDLPAAPRPPLDVREIAIDQIALRGNIRPAYHGIEKLAETLHLQGQLQPCVVRPASPDAGHDKPFELIFGHRRLAAAEFLGWETLRCEVRTISDEATIPQMIVENFQREDLSPVAEARAMYELKHHTDPPLSNADVARMLGCDPSHVSHRLGMIMKLAPPPPPEPEPEELGDEAEEGELERVMEEVPRAERPAPTLAEGDVDPDEEQQEQAEEQPTAGRSRADDRIDILDLVDRGDISASTAEVIASLDDDADQQKLAKLVLRNDWSTKKAAAWVRQVREADATLDEGSDEEMGPAEMLEIEDVVELQHLSPRPDLSDEEIARVVLYGQLRNGMDQEMLDYLNEQMGFPYEALWDYVATLDDGQVAELSRRMAIRYIAAAHRFFELEPALKDSLGLPPEAPDGELAQAAEQAALNLPGGFGEVL